MGARLLFKNASLELLTHQPGAKGLNAILVFSGPMTQDIAEILKCPWIYEKNGNPRAHMSDFGLDVRLRDVDLVLPSASSDAGSLEMRPDLVHKFKVTAIDEFKLGLKFRAHIAGKDHELVDFAQAFNKKEFEMAIRSLQTDFDFTAENPGGTQVDMSGDRDEDGTGEVEAPGPLFACPDCDKDVPLNSLGEHVDEESGEVRRCMHPHAKAVDETPEPLPTMQQMTGRKKPKPRGRGAVTQMPSAAEIEAGVSVQ